MNLFRKNKTKDERVINLQNKIYKEIYILVLLICVVSSVIKMYVYDYGMDRLTTEMLILLGSGVYYSYRSVTLGLFSDEVEMHDRTSKMSVERKNLFIGISVVVAMALFIGVRNSILYAEGTGDTISTFFLIFFVTLIINLPFFVLFMLISHSIMKKRSDKAVNKQLEEMDDNDDGDSDEKY